MKRKTKIVIIAVAAILVLSVAAFATVKYSNSQKEDTEKVKIEKEKDNVKKSEKELVVSGQKSPDEEENKTGYIFTPIKNKSKSSFKKLNDYYANVSFPIPKDWELEFESAKDLSLKKTDGTAHLLITQNKYMPDVHYGEVITAQTVGSYLNEEIKGQVFILNGTRYARVPGQGAGDVKSGLDNVTEDYKRLAVHSYDKINTEQVPGVAYSKEIAAERRYIMYCNGSMMSFSMFCTQDTFEENCKVLDYMVSNMEYCEETLNEFQKVKVFNDFSVDIPTQFNNRLPVYYAGNESGTTYSVATNANSNLAGFYLTVLDCNGKSTKFTKEEKNVKSIFESTFDDFTNTNEVDAMSEFVDDEDNLYPLTQVRNKLMKKGYKVSRLYYTYYETDKISRDSDKFFENVSTWNSQAIKISNGKEAKILLFCYPIDAGELAYNLSKKM